MIPSKWTNEIGMLRLAGYAEGTSLVLLVCVAVPLKRLWGIPDLVSIVGPIHGVTFVSYLTLAINAVSGGGWRTVDIARTVGVAIIPFGTFVNDRFLARRHAGA